MERLYDKKGNVSESNVYQNYDQTKANVVVYKKIVDGTYYVVEAVPDNNAKTLQVISAYIQKNKSETPQLLNMSYDPQLTSKPPVESVSPYIANIPQHQNLVNNGETAEVSFDLDKNITEQNIDTLQDKATTSKTTIIMRQKRGCRKATNTAAASTFSRKC